jgi:hypothetical protein
MEYTSLYVYAIVDGKVRQKVACSGMGARNDEVFGVPFKDVSAIVSLTPFVEYDPTEENTLAHEEVIQALLQEGLTVAPMRFCTIVASHRDLQRMLHSGYLLFKKNLLKVREKDEFDVKVFLDVQKLQTEVGKQNLIPRSQQIAARLYDELQTVTKDGVLSDQVTQEMILNASFLVHRKEREVFHSIIVSFDKQYTDTLKIRISGPTAPYNFVSMPTK